MAWIGHDRCSCWHPALLPAEAGKPGPKPQRDLGLPPQQGSRPAVWRPSAICGGPYRHQALAAYRHLALAAYRHLVVALSATKFLFFSTSTNGHRASTHPRAYTSSYAPFPFSIILWAPLQLCSQKYQGQTSLTNQRQQHYMRSLLFLHRLYLPVISTHFGCATTKIRLSPFTRVRHV